MLFYQKFVLFRSFMQEKWLGWCEEFLGSGTSCMSSRAGGAVWVLKGFKQMGFVTTEDTSAPALLEIVSRSSSSRGSCICESNMAFCYMWMWIMSSCTEELSSNLLSFCQLTANLTPNICGAPSWTQSNKGTLRVFLEYFCLIKGVLW